MAKLLWEAYKIGKRVGRNEITEVSGDQYIRRLIGAVL